MITFGPARTIQEWIRLAEDVRVRYRAEGLYTPIHDFKVGQKILCIDTPPDPCRIWDPLEECEAEYACEQFPRIAKIYTVRIVCPDRGPTGKYQENLQVEEIRNPNTHPEMGEFVGECWWWEGLFQPWHGSSIRSITKAIRYIP